MTNHRTRRIAAGVLDGAAWQECASPHVPARKASDHKLPVRAVTNSTVDATPQTVRWATPYDDRQLTAEAPGWTRVYSTTVYCQKSALTTATGLAVSYR